VCSNIVTLRYDQFRERTQTGMRRIRTKDDRQDRARRHRAGQKGLYGRHMSGSIGFALRLIGMSGFADALDSQRGFSTVASGRQFEGRSAVPPGCWRHAVQGTVGPAAQEKTRTLMLRRPQAIEDTSTITKSSPERRIRGTLCANASPDFARASEGLTAFNTTRNM